MSSQNNIYETILKSPRTVFNIQTLRLLCNNDKDFQLGKSLNYYVKSGKIGNPRRGTYTKINYDEKEMACSLFRPAYISLEYVLQRAGVVFQYGEAVTCVSYLNRNVEVDGKEYQFRIIKPEIWIGMDGIEQHDNICIATPERAFLDMVYLSSGNCCFDNLNSLNKTAIHKLISLYDSKVLVERVSKMLSNN